MYIVFGDILMCLMQILKHIRISLVTRLYLTLATPWTVAHQPPLSMGFPRQEYWSGMLFLPPGDLSDPRIKPTPPMCLTLQVGSFPLNHWERLFFMYQFISVAQSYPTLQSHESQHARPPCLSPTPRVHSNSCPSSQ